MKSAIYDRKNQKNIIQNISLEKNKKIKVIEEVSGMLNDMSEEEIRIFDEAVKRR